MDTLCSSKDNIKSLDHIVYSMSDEPSCASVESKDISTCLRIIFNASPEKPQGIYSINLDKNLVMKNWSKSLIANSIEGEPSLEFLNLEMDPMWLTDYNNYALKKIFEQYIHHNDNSVPDPKWIADGSQIEPIEHCGNNENYCFIMSYASEACCEQILSKYPKYAFPPNEEDELGGLVPGSYNFWYSLKEADAEFEDLTTEDTERFFNANFPKEFRDEFYDKILPTGGTFMNTFDCNEFEAVQGMIQLVGVNLLKDLASISEYIGLDGLLRLASMVIGEQIRGWPKVESCIEQVYEQRIADITKEVQEEERIAKETGCIPIDEDESDDTDDDEEPVELLISAKVQDGTIELD